MCICRLQTNKNKHRSASPHTHRMRKQQHTTVTAEVQVHVHRAIWQETPLFLVLTLRCRRSVRQPMHEGRPAGQPRWLTWSQTPGSSAAATQCSKQAETATPVSLLSSCLGEDAACASTARHTQQPTVVLTAPQSSSPWLMGHGRACTAWAAARPASGGPAVQQGRCHLQAAVTAARQG
jgi:hypothetical protein